MKRAEDFIEELKQAGAFHDAPDGEFTESEAKTEAQQAVEQLFKQIESRAVMLLAIREHGAKELKTKLISKFPEPPELLVKTQEPVGLVKQLVDDVIELCQTQNWQSDERYLDQVVGSMMEKGQGPMKIRQKCQQACQDSRLIDAYLDIDSSEWLAIARKVMMKKYGDLSRPTNRNEQAKRMRFLQSRGFASEVVWKVFR